METIKIPLIALRGMVVFPGMVTNFDCARSKTLGAIDKSVEEKTDVFLVAQKEEKTLNPTEKDIYEWGVIASIKHSFRFSNKSQRILVEGIKRAKIEKFIDKEDYIEAEITPYEEVETEINMDIEAAVRLVKEDLQRYQEMEQNLLSGILQTVVEEPDPSKVVDKACSYLNFKIEDQQKMLKTLDVYQRLITFHEIMKRELELLQIEKNIDLKVKAQLSKIQKEYYLKEQLQVIKDELELDQSKESEMIEKIEEKNLPEEVKEKALKEAKKLSSTNPASPEYAVTLNYLDWILELPWLEKSQGEINLKKAREILDEDHYGLKKIKERILEFIAVRKLSENSKGPILCLVGPPGVGKTSIAKSIARALEKEFVRMSLGGVVDEAEIRGHRRTYVGALPGRVITQIKKARIKDPVFLLDEIDKVGNNYRGDPASGLLEVLDPQQNNTFTDHYLELPFDLSDVFFITTANTTSTIPGPLKDRMEIIELGGYTPNEKFNIAKKYLIKRQLGEKGLKKSNMNITDGAITDIINYYTREAGVRLLEKQISKITRQAALKIVEGEKEKIKITKRNLKDFLGEKKYLYDLVQKSNQVGVVNGLAWTKVGGETLSIEAAILPGKEKVVLTGSLGNVMKESAIAGISYIASNSDKLKINPNFRTEKDIHVHVPEGAVPKDGPSAGITITLAIISALLNRPVKREIAMTGEITLRGRVLPIGGLKEKLLAAERMGIKTVIIPKDNEKDLQEIEDNVKDLIQIIPVSNMDEVIDIALEKENED